MFRLTWRALNLLSKPEQRKYWLLIALRSLNALLDLSGVLVLGYVATSIASYLSNGKNVGETIHVAALRLPALTATSLPIAGTLLVCLFTVKAILSIYFTKALAGHLSKIEAKMALRLVNLRLGHGLISMRKSSKAELLYAVQSGTSAAFNGLLNSFATLVSEGFLFVLLCVAFLAMSPVATLGLFVFLVAVGLAIQVFVGNKLHGTAQVLGASTVRTHQTLTDFVDSFREITVLGLTKVFADRVYRAKADAAKSQADQITLLGLPRYIIETSLLIGVFVFAFLQSLSGDISSSIGVLGVFLAGGFRILAAMLPWQAALSAMKLVIPAAGTALDILYTSQPEVPPAEIVSQVHDGPVALELINVSFEYENSKSSALSAISLNIPAGSQVALIGPSGAGKSTLADLLLGLIRPSHGSCQINGMEASDFIAANPGSVAYVPQNSGLIAGTIRENVALGATVGHEDDKKILEALKLANLETLVKLLPHGLDTDLGNHQDALSGGQLQRLGLARAFYGKPGLLIMDEATSGLDAQTESQIGQSLDSIRGAVTVVLIAHKLNTVQKSDNIVVLQDGRVSAQGTFSEILKTNPGVAEAAKLLALDMDN